MNIGCHGRSSSLNSHNSSCNRGLYANIGGSRSQYTSHSFSYIHLFWYIFSTTNTGKGHESQIYLSGRIDYSFLSCKQSEGIGTENLRHEMMKVRKHFEHVFNFVYIYLHILSTVQNCNPSFQVNRSGIHIIFLFEFLKI